MSKMKSLLFAALLLAAGPAFSQQDLAGDTRDQIAKVQKAIAEKGAKWTAGETAISGLSRADWQYLVGFDYEPMNAEPAPLGDVAAVPSALDWRDANGNYVTAARDQKKCGSCWAFAMTGGLESYVLRQKGTPGADLDLSEQVMVSCSGAGSCKGGRLTASFLKSTGLPLETAYAYTGTDGTCSAAAPGWQTAAYKVTGWGSVSQSVDALKTALVKYGPLPTAMWVYEDFMHYKTGIYSYTTGKKLGGHAVLLVGYNDAEKYFIVKNSWTPGSGENGFFRIAYSEMKNSISFAMSTIAYYNAKGGAAPAEAVNAAAWQRLAPKFEKISWN